MLIRGRDKAVPYISDNWWKDFAYAMSQWFKDFVMGWGGSKYIINTCDVISVRP